MKFKTTTYIIFAWIALSLLSCAIALPLVLHKGDCNYGDPDRYAPIDVRLTGVTDTCTFDSVNAIDIEHHISTFLYENGVQPYIVFRTDSTLMKGEVKLIADKFWIDNIQIGNELAESWHTLEIKIEMQDILEQNPNRDTWSLNLRFDKLPAVAFTILIPREGITAIDCDRNSIALDGPLPTDVVIDDANTLLTSQPTAPASYSYK